MHGITQLRSGRRVVRCRRTFLVGVLVIAFYFGASVTSAWAGYSQDGRTTTVGNIDGGSVYINGDVFNQVSNNCALYSLLVADFSASHHVEVGLVRCTSAVIDGTCNSGYGFAEKWAGGNNYTCVQGLDFNNDTDYYAKIDRTGTNSMIGTINGASVTMSGFLTSDVIETRTWGESTGGSSCPTSPTRGLFYAWTKKVSGTWSTVPSPSIYHFASGMTSPCWGVGTYNSSLGSYDVAG